MPRFLQFVSIAVATQIILLLNQVVLLPMQIRQWGTAGTAAWYTAIALGTLTTVADLGLRTAGHPELLNFVHHRDEKAGRVFSHTWAWIRICLLGSTTLLLIGEVLYAYLHPAWHANTSALLITLAYALETALVVRIVYLDSLGLYRGAEASYFAFAALRLALALPALLVFHLQARGLGCIFLLTSVVGLILQTRLCRVPTALALFGRFPSDLSPQNLLAARYTVAEPCANWVRLSFPVLVIASIATPAAVTTFVALRAVFGAARQTIQQVARVASVEYLKLKAAGQLDTAEAILSCALLLTGFAGSTLAAYVLGDNLRLLRLLLPHVDRSLFQAIALPFALSGAFYSYQIIVAVCFRTGRLAAVASRQYAFVCYSFCFGAVAVVCHQLDLYLGLTVVAEVAISSTFLLGAKLSNANGYSARIGQQSLLASCAGTIAVFALWSFVHTSTLPAFVSATKGHIFEGAVLVTLVLLALFALEAALSVRTLRKLLRVSPQAEDLLVNSTA